MTISETEINQMDCINMKLEASLILVLLIYVSIIDCETKK